MLILRRTLAVVLAPVFGAVWIPLGFLSLFLWTPLAWIIWGPEDYFDHFMEPELALQWVWLRLSGWDKYGYRDYITADRM